MRDGGEYERAGTGTVNRPLSKMETAQEEDDMKLVTHHVPRVVKFMRRSSKSWYETVQCKHGKYPDTIMFPFGVMAPEKFVLTVVSFVSYGIAFPVYRPEREL